MVKYNSFRGLNKTLTTAMLVVSCYLSPAVATECMSKTLQVFIPPVVVEIPAGKFIQGSGKAEREIAYILDEVAYGHSVTRDSRWYSSEFARQENVTPRYNIMKTPVTNKQYQQFVAETCHVSPTVTATEWASYGLNHSYLSTKKYRWLNKTYGDGRANHPVVLVAHSDAIAYANWLSKKTGKQWRLPIEAEWEKAVRGSKGNYFPWGNTYDPTRLNSHDKGAFETTKVGQFPMGASEYGVLDGAGQVFEWTATPTQKPANRRWIVKGGSWDDKGCGVCRSSARHSRPEALKHILIGFRLLLEH